MKIGGAMPKIVKRGFVCAALAITWVAAPGLRAQDKKELLPAPLPAQIFTARKVFVSNAGGDTLGDYSGGPDRAYNQLYTALKGWGRYDCFKKNLERSATPVGHPGPQDARFVMDVYRACAVCAVVREPR